MVDFAKQLEKIRSEERWKRFYESRRCDVSDAETRTKVAELVKEGCPLRTVLKEGKNCPYFGASKTCRDCSYDWETCADGILKLAKSRRALYEKEKEKVDVLTKELEVANEIKKQVNDIFGDVRFGLDSFSCAFKKLCDMNKTMTKAEEEASGRE
jgi:hypothetical protein